VSGSLRQLTYTSSGSLFPNLTALPRNFTFETEIKLDVRAGHRAHLPRPLFRRARSRRVDHRCKD
jgi:hypothetical protein